MKYFTLDLLARFGSEESAVADAAQAEWDQVCDRYNAYLESIKGEMTPGLRQIEERYYLHDAKIRAMGRQGRSFVILLQLDTPPHSLVTLTFGLVEEPVITPAALPAELRSQGPVVEWQYDELELLPGDPATWSWSILLSNGWEVCLRFHDVQVQEAQALIPSPGDGTGTALASALSQSC
jgi:hypothetical protein